MINDLNLVGLYWKYQRNKDAIKLSYKTFDNFNETKMLKSQIKYYRKMSLIFGKI